MLCASCATLSKPPVPPVVTIEHTVYAKPDPNLQVHVDPPTPWAQVIASPGATLEAEMKDRVSLQSCIQQSNTLWEALNH